MRKTTLMACILAFGFSWLTAQTITVTSPVGGASWCLGQPYTITWTHSGAMQGTVAIRLRIAGSSEATPAAVTIANNEANDGSFSWTVPASVAPGSYFIRVRTDDSTVIGDSSPFTIAGCGAPPPPASIVVTSPAAGNETWYVNTASTITWTSTGIPGARIKIGLYQGANQVRVVTADTANSGSFPWTVPDGLISPTPYYFRVATVDNAVHSDSFPFKISFAYIAPLAVVTVQQPNLPRLTITSLLCHGSWRRGTRVDINWTITGTIETSERADNTVFVHLIRPDGSVAGRIISLTGLSPLGGDTFIVGNIHSDDPSHGSVSVPAGNYRLRVSFAYGGNRVPRTVISDSCGEFTITD